MNADKPAPVLVEKAAAGDADAMEHLLARARRTAYRFGLRVCGHPEDAEDVAQDALLQTFRAVAQLSAPEAFRSWLYTVVRNACLMKRRRRAGEPSRVVSIDGRGPGDEGEAVGIDVPDAGRAPDQQVIDAHAARRLHRALIALPPTYRTIVRLRDIDGLSTRDVAAITGMSEAAVKTRLHRARALLRRELQSSSHAI